MSEQLLKVVDVIPDSFSDFIYYCQDAGIIFINDITSIDLVAFRTITGHQRDYINEIKTMIEAPSLLQKCEDEATTAPSDEKETAEESLDQQEEPKSELMSKLQNRESNLNDDNKDTTNEPIIMDIEEVCGKTKPSRSKKNEVHENRTEETDEPVSSLFRVDPATCSKIDVEALRLSVRALNCLKRAQIHTIEDLLNISIDSLRSIRNMGKKSYNEIIEKIHEFISSGNYESNSEIEAFECKGEVLDSAFKTAIEAVLLGGEYATDALSEKQIAKLSEIKDAVDTCGEDICLQTYLNPQYSAQICSSLMYYSVPYLKKSKVVESIRNQVGSLSDTLRASKLLPYLRCFCVKDEEQYSRLRPFFNVESTIASIPVVLDKVSAERIDAVSRDFQVFVNWLDKDFAELIQLTANRIWDYLVEKSERGLEVLRLRASGKTLEEIGSEFGLTRERVRQLEAKSYRVFLYSYTHQKEDLILLVDALNGGQGLVALETIENLSDGRFAPLLWYCEKNHLAPNKHFYSKPLNAIVVRNEDTRYNSEKELNDESNKILASMPKLIPVDEAESLISKAMAENHLKGLLVKEALESAYYKAGSFLSRGKPTVSFMCDYVLKTRFPAGYKIGDDFEGDRFQQYLFELFGIENGSITKRAIDATIGKNGCLCDRGKYIHPDYLQVDQSFINEINDYIEKSPRVLLPYGEIFEAMKEALKGTQITNRYLLQGALKKYGCRFSTGRDFVRKADNVSIVDELEAFMEERGIVHKSEILAEFTAMTDAALGQVVARSKDVFSIDDGYYIHASQFDIHPEDYEPIREYLTQSCAEIPINIRTVQEEIAVRFADFMYRNDFEDRNKLFAALQYMFKDEFSFSRPYIAKLGANVITTKSVLLQHLKPYDSIEIEDLIELCHENSIRFMGVSYLCQSLLPDFLRISTTTLMRRELTGITDALVEEAVEIVADMLESNDYVVGSKVNDFLWFPEINVDWNEFLFESVLICSGKVNIIFLTGDPLKHPNAIYVSDDYKDDSLESFLVKVLAKEVRKGSFLSKAEMRYWLKEQGLIEEKLPSFLNGTEYFYVNQTGVHCREV